MSRPVLVMVGPVIVGACGHPEHMPPRAPASIDAASAFVAPPAFIAPPAVARASQVVCSTSQTPATWDPQPARVSEYDLSRVTVALNYGPPDGQPSAGNPRGGRSIEQALLHRRDRFAACTGTAMAPSFFDRELRYDVRLTLDPFGAAHDVKVAPGDIGGGSLTGPPAVDCIRAVVEAMTVPGVSRRETVVHMTLLLSRVPDAPRGRAKPLPVAPPPGARAGCVVASMPLPVDHLELGVTEVDLGLPTRLLRRRYCERPTLAKVDFADLLHDNLAPVRACYLAAAARQPGLAGSLATEFTIDTLGQPSQVEVRGVGDDQLHQCVATQLALATTTRPPSRAARIKVELVLIADAPHWRTADDALTAGDLDGAVAQFAELARTARDPLAACRARVGIVRAYGAEPNGPDARADGAVTELRAFLTRHPGLDACVADALPVLADIGRWPVRGAPSRIRSWGLGGLEDLHGRATALIAAFPEVARALLPTMGWALTNLDRHDEALAVYLRYFALGDSDATRVQLAADGYAESTARQHDRDVGPVWDDCATEPQD